jgi:hypothetical protein
VGLNGIFWCWVDLDLTLERIKSILYNLSGAEKVFLFISGGHQKVFLCVLGGTEKFSVST